MQIFNFKWLLLPYWLFDFLFQINRVEELMTNCVRFTKIWPQIQTVSSKQEMQIFHIKMATYPLLIFKINRVKAIDKVDKLCKFHN